MTAAVPSPDLQRIVEALKACRASYMMSYSIGSNRPVEVLLVEDLEDEETVVFVGDMDACQSYIDARCAEAMVRAIREPGEAALAALAALLDGPGIRMEGPSARSRRRAGDAWAGTIDAILGEAQP